MDLDPAAPATSRRGLLGALGAVGLASAAALSVARPASAAPTSPTDSDKVLLFQAMRLELTAVALYDVALAAGLIDTAAEVATVFSANHRAYADEIAGASGFSADSRNEELFEQLESAFDTSDDDAFAGVANSLENAAAATHTELLARYESVNARKITASIIVVEARMATVLSDFGGLASNFDELFEPETEPLDLTAGAAS